MFVEGKQWIRFASGEKGEKRKRKKEDGTKEP